ncbi:MAG TPA: FadR/GntR family transcriptional regulator [Thermoleophilia bacterium]|nr:FadR/GntR family transcriptional regulator [Thermoleophilia bacterium]
MPRAFARDPVVDLVRQLLAKREVIPGGKLPTERELSELAGVSRTAVREAIRTLEAEGLVDVRHGYGTFVAEDARDALVRPFSTLLELGEISLEEIMAARQLIEPELAALAALRAADEDVANLRAITRQMRFEDVSPERYESLDTEFHLTIARVSSNRAVVQIVRGLRLLLSDVTQTFFALPQWLEEAPVEHIPVFESIQDRDPDRARTAMLTHLRTALKHTREVVGPERQGTTGAAGFGGPAGPPE